MQQQTLDLAAPRTWGGKRKGAGRPAKNGKAGVAAWRARIPARDRARTRHDSGRARCAESTDARELPRDPRGHARCRGQARAVSHRAPEHPARSPAPGRRGEGPGRARARHAGAISRRGKVFPDRYHAHVLRTPREVRHAIAYVLNNWRKHGEDRGSAWRIDPFSSGVSFTQWRELTGAHAAYRPPPGHRTLLVWLPKTWLLRCGWERHGRFATTARPGAGPAARPTAPAPAPAQPR
jgi:hypothetical protein